MQVARKSDGRSAPRKTRFPRNGGALVGLLLLCVLCAQAAVGEEAANAAARAQLVEWEGTVEVARIRAGVWDPAYTNQLLNAGDRIRTGERSRAVIHLSDQTMLRLGELSLAQVPEDNGMRSRWRFLQGLFYFFHREQPGDYEIQTPGLSTIIRGTEFALEIGRDESTFIAMVDGEVEMTGEKGGLRLRSGEAARASPGGAPLKTPVVDMVNIIQWNLYYPCFLHVGDLGLTSDEERPVSKALAAYARGDVLGAIGEFPYSLTNLTASQRLFQAALLLSAGDVWEAERLLPPVASGQNNAAEVGLALRKVIAATQFKQWGSTNTPTTATGWLAEGYYRQSRSDLEAARKAVETAMTLRPDFALAQEQLAELEFSFGRIAQANSVLDQSQKAAASNPQAWSLQGFLHLARNEATAASRSFDQAIALDGALGNAWLGRGLAAIRRGKAEEGLRDLEVAATVEPQRSVLRSYLGKAFHHLHDDTHSTNELGLARRFDLNDPTPWLYSALMLWEEGRFNEAVRDLNESRTRNDNRSVYRSKLLLDQDQAVRGANLAGIYRDANLIEPGLWEAVKAVNGDYANYSPHLFLAESYDALRDPSQVNLRYEAPWLREYLLSQLLAPVGAGELSPAVTQYEYSRLFETDGFGIQSSTEYGSRGDWRQTATQFGRFGDTSYAVDIAYISLAGQRPNDDLDEKTATIRAKEQLTPADSLFLQGSVADIRSGDLAQYYDPASASPYLRVRETQAPDVTLGYHHEWAPGSHTLLLLGCLQDTYRLTNPEQSMLALFSGFNGNAAAAASPVSNLAYQNDVTILSSEAQQIWEGGGHTLVTGARFQAGDFETQNQIGASPLFYFTRPGGTIATNFSSQLAPVSTLLDSTLQRWSLYAYDHWQVADSLGITAGLSYDSLEYPANFRYPPISAGGEAAAQISPKLGLLWTPLPKTTVRMAYTKSLGGVSFENSFQLEPAQVAGFTQAYRSVIPESESGSLSAERIETLGAAVEQRIGPGTFASLELQQLRSHTSREDGAMLGSVPNAFGPVVFTPVSVSEQLRYQERDLMLALNQLWGREWSLGGRYTLSAVELGNRFSDPSVAEVAALLGQGTQRGLLQQVNLFVLFNHPSGFFSRADALWTGQLNSDASSGLPNDAFWQFDFYAGYRFPRRRAECQIGLLNLAGQDYRLNPVNVTPELSRQRTLTLSFKWRF